MPDFFWLLLCRLCAALAQADGIASSNSLCTTPRAVGAFFANRQRRQARARQHAGAATPRAFSLDLRHALRAADCRRRQPAVVYDKGLAQVTARKLDNALGSSPAALLAGNNDLENTIS